MNKGLVKHYFGILLVAISIVLIGGGIALLVWLGIGQFQAQMNYDGQYITFRTIKDISLWGYCGIPALIVGVFLFPIGVNLQ